MRWLPPLPESALVGVLLLLLPIACIIDPGRIVTVENNSDDPVIIYQSGVPTEVLQPGRSQDFAYSRFEGTKMMEVRPLRDTAVGNILAEESFTWEDLGKRKIRLVVE